MQHSNSCLSSEARTTLSARHQPGDTQPGENQHSEARARQDTTARQCTLGCALFSKFLGLNAVLVELDELSSGVPSFLKSDHGKLLRITILCLVTWVSHGTCVMVS